MIAVIFWNWIRNKIVSFRMGTKQRHGIKQLAQDLKPLNFKQNVPPVFSCVITDHSSSPTDSPYEPPKVG